MRVTHGRCHPSFRDGCGCLKCIRGRGELGALVNCDLDRHQLSSHSLPDGPEPNGCAPDNEQGSRHQAHLAPGVWCGHHHWIAAVGLVSALVLCVRLSWQAAANSDPLCAGSEWPYLDQCIQLPAARHQIMCGLQTVGHTYPAAGDGWAPAPSTDERQASSRHCWHVCNG